MMIDAGWRGLMTTERGRAGALDIAYKLLHIVMRGTQSFGRLSAALERAPRVNMSATYSAQLIAEYLIEEANNRHEPLTNMKLQKLLYYAQGWHLALFDEPLFEDPVEAWDHGPVVPEVYHNYKNYGSAPLTEVAPYRSSRAGSSYYLAKKDPDTVEFLNRISEIFGQRSAVQLSAMTHIGGGPWDKIVNEKFSGRPPRGTDIPEDIIKDYFKSQSNAEAGEA